MKKRSLHHWFLSIFLFIALFSNAQTNYISGKIFVDSIANCSLDGGEKGLKSWKIRAIRPNNDTIYAQSDAVGNYKIPISSVGNYAVQAIAENHYWQSCQVTKVLTTTASIVADLGVQKVVDCHFLQVNVVAPTLKKGQLGNYYVAYRNNGTADAQNAYIDIDIDPFLTLTASSITAQNIGTYKYRFQLGTVAVGEEKTFSITTKLQANISAGITHCVEAHIYPDNLCAPSPKYIAQVLSNCNNGKAEFYIKKLLNQGASLIGKVKIIEDDIVLRGTYDTLKNNQIDTIQPVFQNGKVYSSQIILPNGEVIGKSLQRCDVLDTKGWMLQFSQFSGNPFIHTVCTQNEGSKKSIEKTPLPIGRSVEHFIEKHEALEYTVRFQNTVLGDTVKNVTVLDTLDNALDPATLTMGASSHPYTWELTGKKFLKVTFGNVSLPDSSKNQLTSQGYFSYKVEQKNNLAPFTVINSKSNVILGNQTAKSSNNIFHTIAKPQVFGKTTLNVCAGSPTPPLVITTSFPTYDSLTFVTLNIIQPKQTIQKFTICKGKSIAVGFNIYTNTGLYQDKLSAQNGCDSIVTTNLTVVEIKTNVSKTVCFGESVQIGNTTYSNSGTYTTIIKTPFGCDSTVVLNLNVLSATKTDTIFQVNCSAKGPFGISYVKNTIKTANGCDSSFVFAFATLKADTIVLNGMADKDGLFTYKTEIFKIKKDTILYFEVTETLNPCDYIKYFVKPNSSTSTKDIYSNIKATFSPNPFSEQSILHIENSPFSTHKILLYNALGQFVRKEEFLGDELIFQRDQLAQGMYWYKIMVANIVIYEGRIVID